MQIINLYPKKIEVLLSSRVSTCSEASYCRYYYHYYYKVIP